MYVPLFAAGFASLWTLMLTALTGQWFAVAMMLCAAISLILIFIVKCLKRKRVGECSGKRSGEHDGADPRTTVCVLLSVLFFCALFIAKNELYYKPALSLAGDTHCLYGQIVEILPDSESGAKRYIVKVNCKKSGIELPASNIKVRFSSKTYRGKINDFIAFSGQLYVLGEDSESMQGYYKASGVYLGAYTYEDVETVHFEASAVSGFERVKGEIRAFCLSARAYMKAVLCKYLPKDLAGVLLGMLIGEKAEIPGEISDAFRAAGVVHLLSVSGFHTSLWSMLVYRGLMRLRMGRRVSGAISVVFILCFMAVTGFSKSTVRAGIMLIVFFVGRIVLKEADSLNSLGISALVICTSNSFCGGDAGLILSFFATLGIVVAYAPVMRPVKKLLKKINNYAVKKRVESAAGIVVVSVCTFLFTLPFVMLFIGDLSIVSPVSNLLVSGVSSAAIFLSGLGIIASCIPVASMFCNPVFLVSGLMAKYIVYVSAVISSFPFVHMRIDSDHFKMAIAAILLLCAVAVVLYTGEGSEHGVLVQITAWFSIIILLASIIANHFTQRGVVQIYFPAVGDGSCVVVCYDNNAAIVGCGGDYTVAGKVDDILSSAGVNRVTTLVVPRLAATESSAAGELVPALEPDTVLLPKSYFSGSNTGTSRMALPTSCTAVPIENSWIKIFPDVTLRLVPEPVIESASVAETASAAEAGAVSKSVTDGEVYAAQLCVYDLKILMIFKPSVQPDTIPGELKSSDILFSRSSVPLDLNCSGFSAIIISNDANGDAVRVTGSDIRAAYTSPGGIWVKCKGSKYSLRRLKA